MRNDVLVGDEGLLSWSCSFEGDGGDGVIEGKHLRLEKQRWKCFQKILDILREIKIETLSCCLRDGERSFVSGENVLFKKRELARQKERLLNHFLVCLFYYYKALVLFVVAWRKYLISYQMLEYLIINLNSTEFTIQQGSHNIRQFVDTCIPIIHLKIGPKYCSKENR